MPDIRRPLVRVLAPDAVHLDQDAMAALGGRRARARRRMRHLDHCRHIVAVAGGGRVGFAAFEITSNAMLVHELAAVRHDGAILGELVMALELACLAAGNSRIFISAHVAAPAAALERLAYKPAPWRGWFEKIVP